MLQVAVTRSDRTGVEHLPVDSGEQRVTTCLSCSSSARRLDHQLNSQEQRDNCIKEDRLKVYGSFHCAKRGVIVIIATHIHRQVSD